MRAFWAGLVLAGLLLAVLIVRVDARSLGSTLAAAELLPIASALTLKVGAMLLKAWRWSLAIEAGSGVRPRGVVRASMVGYGANLVMPARLGELARVLVLRRHAPVARSLTLTSAGVGQILDLVTLVLLMGSLAVWGATAGLVDPALLVFAVVGSLSLLAGLLAVHSRQQRLAPLVESASRRLPKALGRRLTGFYAHATEALGALREGRVVAALAALTIAVWALEAVAVAAALSAFGLSAGAATVLLLMAALNLTFVLPLTPGNLGTHQLVSVLVLGSVGVDAAHALAFSIGLQGSAYAVTLALAAGFFYREGIDLATLRRAGSEEPAPASAGEVNPPSE